MLRLFKDLKHLPLGATDGEIGTIKDAYFDDEQWKLRYLVVTTGSWLSGRSVLIAPLSIQKASWEDKRVYVNLTREQIQNAPSIDADKPVSRQYEKAYCDYFGYAYYWVSPTWGGTGNAGAVAVAAAERAANERRQAVENEEQGDPPHVRSANEVDGYEIQAIDGSIGHVKDFLFDESDWSLRYFLVDTRNWLPGRKVLISCEWIAGVSWHMRKVEVTMSREEVRSSPEYDPQRLSQTEEQELYRHYRRKPGEVTRIQIR